MKVIHYIGINSAIRSAGILSAVLLFILSSFTIIPLVHHTDSTEAATGTAQESTLSLDITNATASVDLTVASTNGTFASGSVSNEASFSVTTNNYTGYTLSISASVRPVWVPRMATIATSAIQYDAYSSSCYLA